MAVRIQLRRDLAARWSLTNCILSEAEVGVELETLRWKMGDGVRPWNLLPYSTVEFVDVARRMEVELLATETISAIKAVTATSTGDVLVSDSQDPTRQSVLGISRTAATAGNLVRVVTGGILQDSFFSGFAVNEPVFVSTMGMLTQLPPTSGVLIEIGKYVGDDKIMIGIQRTIFL
jgi:hypothetical protein